jgi:hypothetical protein
VGGIWTQKETSEEKNFTEDEGRDRDDVSTKKKKSNDEDC